ncbi:hypothetical protein Hypma_013882 [Hypsizygus marmoreus]|uniref:Fungal-type protein kinase domain-containing protein n=1 Tax=Hypsizygus marmoreus TaxID=39966 RepID=A0A369K810_HYPMA|nr:hypothetical protein Hypma_013882 [Hypsizygus marmoreus]
MASDLSSSGSSNDSLPDVALAQLRHHTRSRGPAQISRSSHNTHRDPVTPARIPGTALPPYIASMNNGTPIGIKASTSSPFTSNHYYDNEKFGRMAYELRGKFVGAMKPEAFLDEFLPRPYAARKPWKWEDDALKAKFRDVASKQYETQMYAPLIEALKIACGENLVLVNTSAHADMDAGLFVPEGLKPDIGAYKPGYAKLQPLKKKVTDFSLMEVHMELKKGEADDGFEDEGPNFERTSDSGISTRGQITSYATAQLALQFRTHAFSVLLCGSNARFLRWDRTGAVVSSCFDYTEKDLLLEFFWRYGRMGEEQRGKDMSVSIPSPKEAEEARKGLKLDSPEDSTIPLLKFAVVDDTTNKIHYFIGKGKDPLLRGNSSATGRATRTFWVWDLQRHKPALLKDTWRVDLPGIEKEGEIYKELHKHHVPRISKIICAGDVQLVRPSFADNHRTCTHLYSASEHVERQAAWAEVEGLRPHTHYRIVLKTIGISLMDFKSSRQLVTAARDALRALAAAFHTANILHRDISCGNILIVRTGGLLIDWDMAKRVPAAKPQMADDPNKPANSNATDVDVKTSPRQIERSGTWQFISVRLLVPLTSDVPPHALADDMESLLHVLNWVAMRYMPHNLTPGVLSDDLQNIFDHYSIVGKEVRGGAGKRNFLLGRDISTIGLRNPVLVQLLSDLAVTFAVQYEARLGEDASKILRQIEAGELCAAALSESEQELFMMAKMCRRRQRQREDSAWILGLFQRALEDARWPKDDDGSAENKLPPKPNNVLKRKDRETIEENERAVVKQKTNNNGS